MHRLAMPAVLPVILCLLVALFPAVCMAGDTTAPGESSPHEPASQESAPAALPPSPEPAISRLTIQETREAIDRLLSIVEVNLPDLRYGIRLVRGDDGQVLVDHNPEESFVPASNAKIVTSAAVLYHLGAAHRFQTSLYVRGNSLKAGVVTGPLYLQGGGDPTLVYEKVWRICRQLKAMGLTQITGGIVVDTGLFSETFIPGADFETNDFAYQAPPGPLSVSYNAFEIYVNPGPANAPARVHVEPPLQDLITVRNQAVTSSRSTRLALDTSYRRDGGITLTVKGRINAKGGVQTYYRRVRAPWRYSGEVFKSLLQQEGIEVKGKVSKGQVPARATCLLTHHSEPLGQMVATINKASNNFMTETVLLAASGSQAGRPGSYAKGRELVAAFLHDLGVDDQGFAMENASGLGLNNRVTPAFLTDLLQAVRHNPVFGPEFLASLALGSQDGTLRNRLENLAPGSVLRAKTGTLEDALALSGYLTGADGIDKTFSVLVNGCPKDQRSACVAFIDLVAELFSRLSLAPEPGENPGDRRKCGDNAPFPSGYPLAH